MTATKPRIVFLDGLRGIAILSVVLFHAYVRWPDVLPHGNRYGSIPLLNHGGFGVFLFFLISGFVILMTLDKTPDFKTFLYRRWLRLFPAMLIVSLLVYVTAKPFFPERPAGIPVLRDLIPGVTFINESVWERYVFHAPQGMLEGAFWTLFVEVEFYVLFGSLYYLVGVNAAIVSLVALCLMLEAGLPVIWRFPFLQHMGWFAAGAMYYRYYVSQRNGWLATALVTALACAVLQLGDTESRIVGVLIVGLFTFAIINQRVQDIVSHRSLLFLGAISYPLYLVHENMVVALTVKVGRWMPGLPGVLWPVVPMACVIGISFCVAEYGEPALRDLIRATVSRKKNQPPLVS